MLPSWDPARLEHKIPFVAAAVGGRRQGKSTLIHHLLQRMSRRFDLVISFMGTSACSPEMRNLMETRFDPRFIFAEWNEPLMQALLKQQEKLKLEGIQRHVCVLVDDIVLSGKDEDSLAHLCLRGRHFNISVLACAVSYTTLPKRSRRSLDVLFLFSCPMAGDCEILTKEYSTRSKMARYCLQNLPDWTSLVLETLEKRQRLYHFRVPLESGQTEESPASSQDEKLDAPETPSLHQTPDHPAKTDEISNDTLAPESLLEDEASESE